MVGARVRDRTEARAAVIRLLARPMDAVEMGRRLGMTAKQVKTVIRPLVEIGAVERLPGRRYIVAGDK